MTRKQVMAVAAIVILCSILSGTLAYQLVLHRIASRDAAPRVTIGGGLLSGEGKKGCVDFQDAASRIGENTCVSGRVLRVATSGTGNIFLDFCADYRKCPFTSVIFSSDGEKFGNVGYLRGRQIELEGVITEYRGRAEIVIRDPKQIRVSQ